MSLSIVTFLHVIGFLVTFLLLVYLQIKVLRTLNCLFSQHIAHHSQIKELSRSLDLIHQDFSRVSSRLAYVQAKGFSTKAKENKSFNKINNEKP